MKFAPHWTRIQVDLDGQVSETGMITAYGWSMSSIEDALIDAHDRAQRVAAAMTQRMAAGHDSLRREELYYCCGDRPMREPIVEELRVEGELTAAITRNSYGCLVLNTTRTVFIDVDLPPEPDKVQPGFFARLFGAKAEPARTREQRESPIRQRIERVMGDRPDLGLRLYRTRNGFRGVLTSGGYAPNDPTMLALMTDLGTDPLYLRLCEIQDCFRARLTPKPWQIQVNAAPKGFFPPPDDPLRLRSFQSWLSQYDEAREAYSVCEEVARYGPSRVDSEVAEIVDLHHQWVCGSGALA